MANTATDHYGQLTLVHELPKPGSERVTRAPIEIERVGVEGDVADAGVKRAAGHPSVSTANIVNNKNCHH